MWTAEDLMNYLNKNYTFGKNQNAITWDQMVNMQNDRKINREFSVNHGASKIGFISRLGDFVCKFNYWSDDECGYNWDEDLTEEEIEARYGIIDFDRTNDYCDAEYSLSSDFIAAGFGEYIAKVAYFGKIPNTDISMYIQEKAIIFQDCYEDDEIHSTSKDSREIAEEIYNDIYCNDLELTWITDLVEYCGEDEVRRLLNFVDENNINDLHGGNIGYIDNVPVLVDFSGYWE